MNGEKLEKDGSLKEKQENWLRKKTKLKEWNQRCYEKRKE
jgi:hypothetical protein